MRCADVEKLVHPYVDGELVADDNALIERHLTECARCRALVSFQAGFKGNVRARLRARPVASPEAPDRLRAAIVSALDRADERGEGPVRRPWRRLAPAGAAVFAAAAALTFFIVQPSSAESPIVDEAIRAHEKNLPVEIGGDAEVVSSWMHGKVDVPVRPPRLGPDAAALVGGRVYHLRNRDVGQLVYRVGRVGNPHGASSTSTPPTTTTMTVYVFDPSGLELRGRTKRRVGRHDVYLAEERGYTVALYRDRGVGYAFASDLGEGELLRLLSATLGD